MRKVTALVVAAALLDTAWAIAIPQTGTSTIITESAEPTAAAEPKPAKFKYFHESMYSGKYDSRFGHRKLDDRQQRAAVRALVQTYTTTLRDLGVDTWLMHGTLLGWWWNKRSMPWDADADVQVTEKGIQYLAAYYNMSTWYFQSPAVPNGRTYQLEINPNYVHRDSSDTENVIDGRWVDTENGLFIDITAVRYNLTHPEGPGILSCKDGHEFRDIFIFPLLDTTFEDVPVKIPYRYKDLLVAEYGEQSITQKTHENYEFDDERMDWVSTGEREAEFKRNEGLIRVQRELEEKMQQERERAEMERIREEYPQEELRRKRDEPGWHPKEDDV